MTARENYLVQHSKHVRSVLTFLRIYLSSSRKGERTRNRKRDSNSKNMGVAY
jgi:hypothetical protein